MDDDLWVGFAQFTDEKEGIGLEVGVMLPVLSPFVLTGVVCAESEDSDIGSEGEGVFEVRSIGERHVRFPKQT